MSRAESDHILFIPRGEFVVPTDIDPEVTLELIRERDKITYPYSSTIKRILAMNLVVIPTINLDEDGKTWRFHADSVERSRLETHHGGISHDGGRFDTDGIIVRHDRDAVITIGAINPEAPEMSIWAGISTFDLVKNSPEISDVDVITIGIVPDDVYWNYHLQLYGRS